MSVVLQRTAEIADARPKLHTTLAYARHVSLYVNLTVERIIDVDVAPKC